MPAAYCASLEGFLNDPASSIVGQLSVALAGTRLDQKARQTFAWTHEIEILKRVLNRPVLTSAGISIVLEFEIPRRQRRVDSIFLVGGVVTCVEFKIGEKSCDRAARWQAEQYGLDLRDFHEGSRDRPIYPVVVPSDGTCTALPKTDPTRIVAHVVCSSPEALAAVLETVSSDPRQANLQPISPEQWLQAAYKPALTIVEVAESIFAQQRVPEIAYSAANVEHTERQIREVIVRARTERRKVLCLLTGVPGAGKTLVALRAAHDPSVQLTDRAIFLSGNGPLIKVVRGAIVRDRKLAGTPTGELERVVSTFIQNVHAFIRHYAKDAMTCRSALLSLTRHSALGMPPKWRPSRT